MRLCLNILKNLPNHESESIKLLKLAKLAQGNFGELDYFMEKLFNR
jgi:hypothetical protein